MSKGFKNGVEVGEFYYLYKYLWLVDYCLQTFK